jgi:hypothetical protein
MIEINIKEHTHVNFQRCSRESLDYLGSLYGFKVNGELVLNGCGKLTKLPNSLIVRGNLDLVDCDNLKKLPDDLKVGGTLYLMRSMLKNLPDNLEIGEDLSIWGSIELSSLPSSLTIGSDFYLGSCFKLKKLPDDLHVGGYIYYDSNTGFSGHVHEPGVIPDHLKHKLKKWD